MRKYENEIVELKNNGYSFNEIGKRLNISKQYAHNTYTNYLNGLGNNITKKQMELLDRIKYKNIRDYLKKKI